MNLQEMSLMKPVRDIMTPEPVCALPSMTIRAIVELFETEGVSGAPVVDHHGTIIGVVSKSDLLHASLEHAEGFEPRYLYELLHGDEDDEVGPASGFSEPEIRVEDFMTSDPLTASPSDSVVDVASMMHDARVHRIIIIDKNRFPIGIVTSLDLVRLIADQKSAVPDAANG